MGITFSSSAAVIVPPVGIAEVRRVFGDITVEDENIVAPKNWESRCMTMVSDLPGWRPRHLYLNKAIVEPLRLALQRCIDLGDGYVIKTLGCFSPRLKRVNGELSTHSWGIAVDLNSDANPLTPINGQMHKDLPDDWISIFKSCGFTWGGDFHRPDPMHFQWCSGY